MRSFYGSAGLPVLDSPCGDRSWHRGSNLLRARPKFVRGLSTLLVTLLGAACWKESAPECLEATKVAIPEALGAQNWCIANVKRDRDVAQNEMAVLDECAKRLTNGVARIDSAKAACRDESAATHAEIDGLRCHIADMVRTMELIKGIKLGTNTEMELFAELLRQTDDCGESE